MREKVQIPDKMTAKMDKIVKSLKKSVKGHAKQAQTIGKLASMDKVDEISKDTLRSYSTKASDASRNRNIPVHKKDNRVAGVKKAAQRLGEKHMGPHVSTGRKMTDAEMKKREDIKKGLMKSKSDFKDRYGKDADQVMNALATKKAMEANEAIDARKPAKPEIATYHKPKRGRPTSLKTFLKKTPLKVWILEQVHIKQKKN